MTLHEKIAKDLTVAMKAKAALRVSCLRMLKTALKNRQVEIGRELEDEEVQAVISSQVRKGKEAAGEFRNAGREELALKEEQELEVLFEYLPKQMTPDEIEKILKEIIAEISAQGPKDTGKVMKSAMAKIAGQAQGKAVSEIARKLLG